MTKSVLALAAALFAPYASLCQQITGPSDAPIQVLNHPGGPATQFLTSNPTWQSLTNRQGALLFSDMKTKGSGIFGNVTHQDLGSGAWVQNDPSLSATGNGWRIDGTANQILIQKPTNSQHVVTQTYTDYTTKNNSVLAVTFPTLTYTTGFAFNFTQDGLSWDLRFLQTGVMEFGATVSKRLGAATHSFAVASSETLAVNSAGLLVGDSNVGLNRAMMIPRFGKPVPCSAWSYSSTTGVASFTCDDSAFKADQLPYRIDPQSTTFTDYNDTLYPDNYDDGQGDSSNDPAYVQVIGAPGGEGDIINTYLPALATNLSSSCSYTVESSQLNPGDSIVCNAYIAVSYQSANSYAYPVEVSITVNSGTPYSDWAVVSDVQETIHYTLPPPPTTSVSPSSGSSAFGASQNFVIAGVASYYNPYAPYGIYPPYTSVSTITANFGGTALAGNCAIMYNQQNNYIYLNTNSGSWTGGPVYAGQVLQNSQCSISLGNNSVTNDGNVTPQLAVAITFSSTFTGNKAIWVSSSDIDGVTEAWTQVGTWTVTAPTPPPSISSLSPVSGPVAASVTIAGSNFGATQGSSAVKFNGVTATPTSWSATSIVAAAPSGASTGNVVVTVSGTASSGVTFTVLPIPSISSLSPSSAAVSASVTITGSNFGTSQGSSTVRFNGIAATPTGWSATSIVVPVPSGATTGNVVVTVSGVASAGASFTVLPTPSISSLSPTSGPVSRSVTIAGSNFGASQGGSTVGFNGTAATPTSWSATSIVTPVPSGATSGNVIVTATGVASGGVSFTVLPTPSISSLTPGAAPVSAAITISGANFGSSQGSSTVTFNGTTATPTSWSATSIVAPVPSGAASGNVVVTVNGVASSGASFTVNPPPNISSLNPSSGSIGASVTIAGSSFGSSQGSSTVSFNGTTVTPTSWGATSIVAPVPAGATTGNVLVTVSGVASGGVSFTVLPTPSISGVSPNSAAVGTAVTIAGTNFGTSQNGSTVSFNGTAAVPTSWSATSVVVPVPSGAATGNIIITVSGVASSGTNFTVLPTPNITSLTPNSASVNGAVTIAGTNFGTTQGSSTVSFNGTTATPTNWSATSIVAPVPSGATTGNVTVTENGVVSNGMSFTVLPPPTISGAPTSPLSPGGQITISAGQAVSWSVSPSTAGSFSPTSSSANQNVTFTVANPIPNSSLTATITAVASGEASGTATINLLPPVSITPSGGVSLAAGATQQYSANIPVNWSASPSNGGTFSLTSTTAGQQSTFTMGSSGAAIVTITATDQRYSTNQASTTVADPPTLTTNPTTPPALSPGGNLSMWANQSVTWSVNPASSGSFSASSSSATVPVTFTVANPIPNSALTATITATGSGGSTTSLVVNLVPPVTITPANPVALDSGSTAQFSANIPVNWNVVTTSGGSVSPTATAAGQAATFTMGTTSGNVTLTATDQRYSSNSASVTIPPGTGARHKNEGSEVPLFCVSYPCV